MNCYRHPDLSSVFTCPKCGVGMCTDCYQKANYAIEGKPVCHNCDKQIYLLKESEYEGSVRNAKIWLVLQVIALVVSSYFIINLCINGSNHPNASSWIFGAIICVIVTFWGQAWEFIKGMLKNNVTDSVNFAVNPWTWIFTKGLAIIFVIVILYFISYLVPFAILFVLGRNIYRLKVSFPKAKAELDEAKAYIASMD